MELVSLRTHGCLREGKPRQKQTIFQSTESDCGAQSPQPTLWYNLITETSQRDFVFHEAPDRWHNMTFVGLISLLVIIENFGANNYKFFLLIFEAFIQRASVFLHNLTKRYLKRKKNIVNLIAENKREKQTSVADLLDRNLSN